MQTQRLLGRGYTNAERALASNHAPGDVMAFHRPCKRLEPPRVIGASRDRDRSTPLSHPVLAGPDAPRFSGSVTAMR